MGEVAWGRSVLDIHDFGDRAVMVTCSEPDERSAVAATLRQVFGVHGVRSGMAAVLVEQPQPVADLAERVVTALRSTQADNRIDAELPRAVDIPMRYDGIDLAECADLLDGSQQGLASAHSAQVWQVAMIGFAPGFGYLVPIGEVTANWSAVPRRSSPRTQVEPGSVAVAAGMSAVYPAAMPGGWQLIGHTDTAMFDPMNDERPALLAEGDIVRFHP